MSKVILKGVVDIRFPTNLMKNERAVHTLFLIAGIVLLAYILLSIKVSDIVKAFNVLGFNILILCLIVLIVLVIKSIRFKFLLKKVGDLSFLDVFKVVFETTLYVVYSPGKTGEVMKLDLFKMHGIRRADSFAAIIVERISDLVMVLLFSLGILFSFSLNLYPIILVMIAGIVSVIVLYKSNIFKGVIGQVLKSIKKFGDKKTILMLCILTPLLWLADAFIPYFTLKLLGYDISFQTIASLYFVSTIIGLISMIPGGLGSMDFSFSYAASSLLGILRSDAIITMMISRIVVFIVCFGGSIMYFKEFREIYRGR